MRINERPQAWECPDCGVPTISALRDGIYEQVHVDPVALTPLGELQAVSAGRETFCHWGGPTGGLDTRHAAAIHRWPAGSNPDAIRPEHRCGSPPPDHIPDRRYAHHDRPPY